MPYGFANAPAVFVLLLILTISLKQVKTVLSHLQQHQLYVKADKCESHTTQTTFLGYNICHQGVEMDVSKIQAVTEWPKPNTVMELQRFLSFANFYCMVF